MFTPNVSGPHNPIKFFVVATPPAFAYCRELIFNDAEEQERLLICVSEIELFVLLFVPFLRVSALLL